MNQIKKDLIKVAIGSENGDPEEEISEVFGRSQYFIIAEIKEESISKTESIKNESTNQMSGAGILTARLMAENNIDIVIANNIGPRALDVLKQFNIKVYSGNGKIKNILNDFIKGELKEIK